MGILLFLFYALLGAVIVWSVSYLIYRIARGLRGDCGCNPCGGCGHRCCNCEKKDGGETPQKRGEER